MFCCLLVGFQVILSVICLSNAPQQPILLIYPVLPLETFQIKISVSRRFFDVLIAPRYEKGCLTILHAFPLSVL